MERKGKVPSMVEVVRRGEAETVRRAREVFRSSLVVGMEPIFGYENLAKLEAWFINEALASYRATMSSEIYLEAGLTVLNAAAWLAGLELYEKMMLGFYEKVGGWRERRAVDTMAKIETDVRKAQETIANYPKKLEEIGQLNERIAKFVDDWVRPVTNGLGESVGAVGGFGVMILAIVGGSIGYISGKAARAAVEVIKETIKKWLKVDSE